MTDPKPIKSGMPIAVIVVAIMFTVAYLFNHQADRDYAELQYQREQDEKWDMKSSKKLCNTTAEIQATEKYRETCTYDCEEGYFYTADRDRYYEKCLDLAGY